MSKAATAQERTAAEDLAGLRRQSAEVDAELEQLATEKAGLQKQLSNGVSGAGISETVRRLLGGEKAKSETAAVQLARLEERENELSKASEFLFAEIVRLARQESVDQLAPLYEADRRALIDLAAAADRMEDAVKARRATRFAIEQATAGLDFWNLHYKLGVKLPFDPRQAEISTWFVEFLAEGTTPLTSDEKIREALWFNPTAVERWREQLHELGLKLARPAMWAERAKGYVSQRKPVRGPNVFVRLITTLADPIGPGLAGRILEVSADEADQLLEARSAVLVSDKEAKQAMRDFSSRKKGELSREEIVADRVGDAPVQKHLAGVRVQEDRTPAAWTAVAEADE